MHIVTSIGDAYHARKPGADTSSVALLTLVRTAYAKVPGPDGRAVAIFAMARKLAILIYRMRRYGQDYVDQGVDAYEEQFKARRVQSILSTAKQMGYEVTPTEAAA